MEKSGLFPVNIIQIYIAYMVFVESSLLFLVCTVINPLKDKGEIFINLLLCYL